MDRINKQLVKELITTQEIIGKNESDNFEYYVNYSVVSDEYNRTFNLDDISIGAGLDTGIDGLAIIVNGNIVDSTEEIDNLLESNGFLEVSYIFIQAKTSSSFNASEIRTFADGVKDFFRETPTLPRNKDIQKKSDISNYIIDNASKFKDNPKCKLYFVTTGIYNENDQNIESVKNNTIYDLENYNLFQEISFKILGANEIGKLYRKTKKPISANFTFSNKVTLDNIEGISEAYYGVLPFSEFKKLIVDDNDNIANVFDDNVRDFQGDTNPVNAKISETLTSDNPFLFSVINNGVTIVANEIKTSGNTFTIDDYQIVNGCQTSNVLFINRENENIQSLNIPIRLIGTRKDEVKSKITVSTNNQTAIKPEQLSAMSEFQKNLELYYNSIEGEGKLYYERRSKQYNSDPTVIKRRIITTAIQIKSFSAMFSNDPHSVTNYFSLLVKKLGKPKSALFEEDHQFAIYYLAGLAFYRLDTLFINNTIDTQYKKVKFFLLMLFRMLVTNEKNPPLNSQNKVEKFSDPIIKILNNVDKTTELFLRAIKIIDDSKVNINDKQFIKSKAMTERLIEEFEKCK
ncbi:AIPR family protein [bacterium]|nr:AIPR family protein [bacterium]MBU1959045.1 AIPR family protein [bacterium]